MRLILTDEFLADRGRAAAENLVRDFIDATGVFNTTAGTLVREDRFDVHATVYQVSFNSRAWTGL